MTRFSIDNALDKKQVPDPITIGFGMTTEGVVRNDINCGYEEFQNVRLESSRIVTGPSFTNST